MSNQAGVARWYTGARKLPAMIGRLHDGTAIKGGPYTLAQAFSVIGTLVVGWKTMWLWKSGSLILDVGYILLAAIAVGWVTGRLPDDRNPVLWAGGLLIAVSQPRWGRVNGRRLSTPRPVTVHSRLVVESRPMAPAKPAPLGGAQLARPVISPQSHGVRQTGVEALLAARRLGEQR